MNAYLDTGVLIKNYCLETNSRDAVALLLAEPAPLPLSPFQESELRNVVRLKIFRQEISAIGAEGALANFEADILAGRFFRPDFSLASVFRKAEKLSMAYTSTTGARTLDILHVAAALEIGAKSFISFDERQRTVARKAGLKIRP